MRRLWSRKVIILSLLQIATSTVVANGQISFLDGIFKNVEDIAAFGSFGSLRNEGAVSADRIRGFGLEVSFEVGTAGCLPNLKASCPPPKRSGPDVSEHQMEYKRGDTTFTLKYTPASGATPDAIWGFSAALGYAQITGFESSDSSFTLTGNVDQLPTVAAYVAYHPQATIAPYIGFRAGLARLAGFRAYVADSLLHTASGITYLLGAMAGIAGGTEDIQLFGEVSYTYSNFSSIEWSAVSNLVPRLLPRKIDLSSIVFNIGLQVSVN